VKILSYFLVILLPPLIILSNFYYLFFNSANWQKLFDKSGVYQSFSKEEADKQASDIINFYENKNDLDTNFYSPQAILHLLDVKRVLFLTTIYYLILLLSFLSVSAVLVLKKQAKLLLESCLKAGLVSIIFVIGLGVGLSNAFDWFFIVFHKTVFTNDLWMFPAGDNLIKLFPQEFFVSFANRLALQIVLSSVLISIIAYIVRKKLYDSA